MKAYKFSIPVLFFIVISFKIIFAVNGYSWSMAFDKPNLKYTLLIPITLIISLIGIASVIFEMRNKNAIQRLILSIFIISMILSSILISLSNYVEILMGSSLKWFLISITLFTSTTSMIIMIFENRILSKKQNEDHEEENNTNISK